MNYHVGDVRPLTPDLLLDLARACVGVGEARRAVEAEREERHEPPGRAQEPQGPWLGTRPLLDDASHDGRSRRVDFTCLALIRQRLEMRLHARDLRDRRPHGSLELLGDLWCLVEREVARAIDVE